DGFHNPSLAKDFSVLVVDARRGIGNGRVIPAGPLRAPVDGQLTRAQALVVVGTSSRGLAIAERARTRRIPVFQAHLRPDAGFIAEHAGRRVLAFAGVGDRKNSLPRWPRPGSHLPAREAFPTITATRRPRRGRCAMRP